MNGNEWVVEAYGCDPVRLGDVRAMGALFDAITRELALNPVGEALWHRFPEPGGVTGLLMLAESHLAVHTFPEHESLCLNLFCCTPRPEWNWEARMQDLVGARAVRVRTLTREYVPNPARFPSPVSSLG